MTFNTPLAVKVLAHIEDLNEYDSRNKHNQAVWSSVSVPRANFDAIYDETTHQLAGYGSCGTAGCFAGWTAHLQGLRLNYYQVSGPGSNGLRDLLGVDHRDIILHADEVQDGRTISHAACEALGIYVPKIDCNCDHGEYDSSEVCNCELGVDYWDYEESMPELFNGNNDIDMIYIGVAAYAGITVQELQDLVTDEREKYVFDPEKWDLVREEQVIEEPTMA